jgi:hypothetical protein
LSGNTVFPQYLPKNPVPAAIPIRPSYLFHDDLVAVIEIDVFQGWHLGL